MKKKLNIVGEAALRHGVKGLLQELYENKEDAGAEEMSIEDLNSIRHGDEARSELMDRLNNTGLIVPADGIITEELIRQQFQPVIDEINDKYSVHLEIDSVNITVTEPTILNDGRNVIDINISGGDYIESFDITKETIKSNVDIRRQYVSDRLGYVASNLSLDESDRTANDVKNKISQIPNTTPDAEGITEYIVSNFAYTPATAVADGSIQASIQVKIIDTNIMSMSHMITTVIRANTETVANNIATGLANELGDSWRFYQSKSALTDRLRSDLTSYVSNNLADQGLITGRYESNKNCEAILDTYNIQEGSISYSFHVQITTSSGSVVSSGTITRNYTYDVAQFANYIFTDMVKMQFSMSALIWNTNPDSIKYLVDDNILSDVNYSLRNDYATSILSASSGTVTVSGSTANIPIIIQIGTRTFSFTHTMTVG